MPFYSNEEKVCLSQDQLHHTVVQITPKSQWLKASSFLLTLKSITSQEVALLPAIAGSQADGATNIFPVACHFTLESLTLAIKGLGWK